jgi:hypothetical protein
MDLRITRIDEHLVPLSITHPDTPEDYCRERRPYMLEHIVCFYIHVREYWQTTEFGLNYILTRCFTDGCVAIYIIRGGKIHRIEFEMCLKPNEFHSVSYLDVLICFTSVGDCYMNIYLLSLYHLSLSLHREYHRYVSVDMVPSIRHYHNLRSRFELG